MEALSGESSNADTLQDIFDVPRDIGMRTQVGRRSHAWGPLFVFRLSFSCTASRRGRWGDACLHATPLALQQWACLGAESQAAGRTPPAGDGTWRRGATFFSGFRSPVALVVGRPLRQQQLLQLLGDCLYNR